MADLLGVLGVLGAGNRIEGNQNQGPRRGWKKDDCSKSKSWSKSRGHKKACKH